MFNIGQMVTIPNTSGPMGPRERGTVTYVTRDWMGYVWTVETRGEEHEYGTSELRPCQGSK